MQFSIIIPTFENHKYLKTSINSIKKNSKFNHEIIVHINGEDKETENFLINSMSLGLLIIKTSLIPASINVLKG